MDPNDTDHLHCIKCWIKYIARNPPKYIRHDLYLNCIGVLWNDDDKLMLYKYAKYKQVFNEDGEEQDPEESFHCYYKKSTDELNPIEMELYVGFERNWTPSRLKGCYFIYSGKLIIKDLKIDDIEAKITVQRYEFGYNPAPICVVNNFVSEKQGDAISERLLWCFNDKRWQKKWDDSIQGNNSRIKIHCGHFYSTRDDHELRPCRLKWTDLFPDSYQQNVIKQCIRNAYCILSKLRVKGIDFLLGPIGKKPMVIMGGVYHGGQLTCHVDGKFKDVVLVIIMRNRGRGRRAGMRGTKKISFGFQTRTRLNKLAELENEEYSMYCFWSWLVDYGVHGVPYQANNDSAIVIVRKRRFL